MNYYFLNTSAPSEIPDEVWTLTGQAMTVLDEPIITLIQAGAVTVIGEQGELVAGDLLRDTMVKMGAKVVPPDIARFDAAPASGWQVRFDAGHGLVVSTPAGDQLYDGDLESWGDWRARLRMAARERGGVVVLTGPRGSLDDLGPAIVEGRACWIRVPLTDAGDPAVHEQAVELRRRYFDAMGADARLDPEQDHPEMDAHLAELEGALDTYLDQNRDALCDHPAWSSWYEDRDRESTSERRSPTAAEHSRADAPPF